MSWASYPARPAERPRDRVGRRAWPASLRLHPELVGLLALTSVLNLWNLSINGWANTYYCGRRALDEHELARLPVRLARQDRADDRRQAAAGLLGPGAVGAGVRLSPAEHPGPRGADGRGRGRARLRPDPPDVRPGGRRRRRPGLRARPRSRSPSRGTTTPTSCSSCAAWRRCGALCARCETGRTRWLVLSGVCVGLGFETKMGVALLVVPGIALAWMWTRWGDTWRARFTAARQLLAGGARDDRGRRRLAAARDADPGRRPAVDLRHLGQQHLVVDLRLQRPRPRGRPDRRPRWWRGGPAGAAGALAETACSAAPPDRSACSSPRSAIRPAGCSALRSSPASPPRPHRGCAGATRAPAG